MARQSKAKKRATGRQASVPIWGSPVRRSRRLARVFSIVVAALVLIGTEAGFRARSQQTSMAGIDIQERSRSIESHLDAVIQFYRASTQPTIQKAGEPNDAVYRDQAVAQSTQIAAFAFQSAKAEAALLAKYQAQLGGQQAPFASSEQQKMQTTEANVEKRIEDLEASQETVEKQITTARPKDIPPLEAQRKQIKEALSLANAMKDALQKILGMSGVEGGTGLAADIDRLQRSVPELDAKNKTAAPQLELLSSARSAGVTSQGFVLVELFETKHSLDGLLQENADLQKQVTVLRAPLGKLLRGIIQQDQLLAQPLSATAATAPATPLSAPTSTTATPSPADGSTNSPQSFVTISTEFKALSAAAVPLSQEIIMLEQSRANLDAWKNAANEEYASILHTLLLRVIVIVIALGLIFGGGELWRRATNKYVRDIRRRRQLFIVRRFVVGFLSVIVIVFGFVTQFNSLATFAGFITAGIAVGLQTMLLSVAAYFFIIGRYGIKVGDRITIASVTGDVVDVGLVRFYLMELAGSGTSLNPTGRIAVFSNAVLFQAGTPLYKQIPGTNYAWRELIVKLNDSADYTMVSKSVMREVQAVYQQYRSRIEQQHQGAESWMQTSIDSPGIESRLQFVGGVFQLWVRFPVEIENGPETDDKIIRALLELISKSPEIKAAIAATPVIQNSVKG